MQCKRKEDPERHSVALQLVVAHQHSSGAAGQSCSRFFLPITSYGRGSAGCTSAWTNSLYFVSQGSVQPYLNLVLTQQV